MSTFTAFLYMVLFSAVIFANMKFLTMLAFKVKKEYSADVNRLCLLIALCSTLALVFATKVVFWAISATL